MKKLGMIGLTTVSLLIPSSIGLAATDGVCTGNEVTCLQLPENGEWIAEDEAYQFLHGLGVFHGYANGEAQLAQKTTRAQVAATLQRMFQLEIPGSVSPHQNLAGYWAYDVIRAVQEAGWMVYEDGKFQPGKHITSQELAEILAKAAKLNTGDYASIWLPADSEYQDDLAAVLTEKLLPGADDYTIEVTRGDLAVSLYQLYHYMIKKEPGSVISALFSSLKVDQQDEGWKWSFDVVNQTEAKQTVTFSSGMEYDYILYKDGEKIEQFSDGKQFIMIYQEKELAQGDKLHYEGSFQNLEPGNYTLEVWLAAKGVAQAKKTVSFAVEE
ncbi:intracellular proteinase inhibitor BsuPI [Bacillus oleivorans]|uniref:Intracellular proteinase inhibitor BsuPI n=1 Tax=Bacillus oleivorans TaxID=1448271 RepID=A0A285CHM4_9BACI|nr:BsuPI-related putative proteinase inhibitor [Bacillus oleivorans]SNX67009.1 intracellular proteinase inhibitor BsuPI [Bacillus oleivorans]